MPVTWSDEKYSLDIPVIDEQHRELFAITNRIFDAQAISLLPERKKSVLNLLKRLSAYAHFHFAAEEELMQRFQFVELPLLAQHHAGFRTKIQEFLEAAKDTHDWNVGPLLDYLVQWIVFHVQEEDQKYAHFFQAQGILPQLHITPGSTASPESVTQDVLSLWEERHLALDIRGIDDQHKEQIAILQQANDLLLGTEERQRAFLPGIIQKLGFYAQYHFSFEEELMSRYQYSQIGEQKKMHHYFMGNVQAFDQEFRNNEERVAEDIVIFLKSWTIHHIVTEDAKFKAFLKLRT